MERKFRSALPFIFFNRCFPDAGEAYSCRSERNGGLTESRVVRNDST